jgi:hypothetical protein
MGRRRSSALRDAAGVYHVASRLAHEGFHATVARGGGAGADILAGLPGSTDATALMVRTTDCPTGFGGSGEGEGRVCEWRVGKPAASADDPDAFVVLVDLRRYEGLPRVWVVPSAEIRGRFASLGENSPWIYGPSVEELSPYEDDWDAIEHHLLRDRAPWAGWFERQELAELYGEEFVTALNTEASRLLGVENSTIRRMADERFPPEELADASALLSVLFRRWMEEKRQRSREGRE